MKEYFSESLAEENWSVLHLPSLVAWSWHHTHEVLGSDEPPSNPAKIKDTPRSKERKKTPNKIVAERLALLKYLTADKESQNLQKNEIYLDSLGFRMPSEKKFLVLNYFNCRRHLDKAEYDITQLNLLMISAYTLTSTIFNRAHWGLKWFTGVTSENTLVEFKSELFLCKSGRKKTS